VLTKGGGSGIIAKLSRERALKKPVATHTNNRRFRESEMAVVQTGKRLFGDFGGLRRSQEDLEN
jgi:hypothetical protein